MGSPVYPHLHIYHLVWQLRPGGSGMLMSKLTQAYLMSESGWNAVGIFRSTNWGSKFTAADIYRCLPAHNMSD